MTDQMKSRVGKVPHIRIFPLERMQMVLAEIAQPKLIASLNRRGGKNLRYRYQRNRGRRAAGARRCAGDTGLHLLKPVLQIQSRQLLFKFEIRRASKYSPRITPIAMEPVTI